MNLLELIPGALINFVFFAVIFMPILAYIFRDKKLNLIEISLLSLVASTLSMPLFIWLLNFIFPFSLPLVLFAFAVPLAVSAYLIYSGKVSLEAHHLKITRASIIMLLLVLAAFWLRLQSLSAFFYEFDPYYYMFMTEFLLTQGEIPPYDSLVYASTETIVHGGETYELRLVGHRNLPNPQYLAAVWYLLSTGGGEENYNHLQNAVISNIYPPLVAALMVFLAYFLFRDRYSERIALAAAFLVAFMPVLFTKFIAGVSEQLPWGLYAGLAGITFIYFATRYSENKLMYALAVVGILGALMGSKAGMIPVMVGAAYFVARSAVDFVHGERKTVYYELPLVLAFAVSLMNFAFMSYHNAANIGSFVSSNVLVLLFSGALSLFIYHLPKYGKEHLGTMRKRIYALCGLGLLSAIFLITPFGQPILSYGMGLAGVGMIGEDNALVKTVAEENLHSEDLTKMFGPAGVSLDISKFTSKYIGKYGSLDAVPIVFLLLLVSLAFCLLYDRENSDLILLMFILVFSISFIGLQKIKYTPHLGLVLALGIASVIGEAHKGFSRKGLAFYLGFGPGLVLVLISAIAVLQYAWGFTSFTLLSGPGIERFAPADAFSYLIFGAALAGLLYFAYNEYRGGNAPSPKPGARPRIDGVLGVSAVLLVLPFAVNSIEFIMPSIERLTVDLTDHAEVTAFCGDVAEGGAKYAPQLYCNLIPSYWYEPMEWMRQNVDDESYVISWWDYGHWTNFFARKNTVTRNDHPFVILDLEVADKFVNGTPSELSDYMKSRNSTYALFDTDLIGKWGALTYLSCVYNGDTSPKELPSESVCSAMHQFERLYVPREPTLDSVCPVQGKYGVMGISSFGERYCLLDVGGATIVHSMSTGKQVSVIPARAGAQTINGAVYNEFLMVYYGDGLNDAPGKGYNSVFYRAFFLGELEGFVQVYPAQGGMGIQPVRIYRRIA